MGSSRGAESGDAPEEAAAVALASASSDELVDLLDLLAETIVEAMGFTVAAINLVRDDGQMEVLSVAGDPGARAALLGKVEPPGLWDELRDRSEPCGSLRFLDHRRVPAGSVSFAWTPIVVPADGEDAWHPDDALFALLTTRDGVRLGMVTLGPPPDGRRPDEATCQALEAFAVAAALAIEHYTLRARAEGAERRHRELAMRDHLTGAANRPVFAERIHELSGQEQRDGVAVLFVDLDHFKRINDRYSHLAGDHVLGVVVQRIQSCLRATDLVVRWGGDEFVIVVERANDHDAVEIAKRITAAIGAPVEYEGAILRVRASAGVVYVPPGEALDPDNLIRRADQAMYKVKHGRP